MNATSLSIVVPAKNEQDNLPELFQQVRDAVDPLGIEWEILFIDDGSTDNTLDTAKALARDYPRVRYVSFEENRGQSAAFAAGFQEARFDLLATMDADLQNDPTDIPRLLEKMGPGVDMVIGWRAKRQDSFAKRIASRLANRIRNAISRETVRDTGCSLKVMRTDMAREIPMFTGMHRFLPTLMKMRGAVVAEVKVNHRPRLRGKSNYGIIDRALTTWSDLLAVRWMQSRHIEYKIKEKN